MRVPDHSIDLTKIRPISAGTSLLRGAWFAGGISRREYPLIVRAGFSDETGSLELGLRNQSYDFAHMHSRGDIQQDTQATDANAYANIVPMRTLRNACQLGKLGALTDLSPTKKTRGPECLGVRAS